jgi:prolyl-tRNA synthetase
MAEATAADGQMKDLSISEVKKSKKDGNPQKAAKKPQQQKKKVRRVAHGPNGRQHTNYATD